MPITVDSLSFTYHPGTPLSAAALCGVSFEFQRGEWLSVVGHTGSGKSTLAQHLNGILIPQTGSVLVDGMAVTEKSPSLRTIRQRVGLVFQYPEQQLFAENVFEEIAFAPRNWGVPEGDIPELVRQSLALIGLDEGYLGRSPFRLSGGEKRKVAIASVLSASPKYLVLDEPTAGLDAFSKNELVKLLGRLKGKGYGILLVTHDLDIALQTSDRILVLNQGQQVLHDAPAGVMAYLQSNHVPGLRSPDIVALSTALQAAGRDVPLTWDWRTLARYFEESHS